MPRNSEYTPRACYPYYFTAQRPELSHKLIGKDWIPSVYGQTKHPAHQLVRFCLTMRFCVVLACSTSPTSSVNEDWVSLVMPLDFEVMHRQTRSFEFVPRRGTVTGDRPLQEWRRASGRPRSWIHQICRDTGVTATEALELAEDKPFWRTIATAGRFG